CQLNAVPEQNMSDTPINRIKRWDLVQRIHRDLWKRWSLEYLNTLQQRSKWAHPATPLLPGAKLINH
ncbi:hypothetical protein, partial [Klebsiella pneumoniae]|uniref:hypothetical protein n=1 Tax=Klebsiella pneumoniae TaxID=573 RepID=UPI004055555D